jgi:hypothetical protein
MRSNLCGVCRSNYPKAVVVSKDRTEVRRKDCASQLPGIKAAQVTWSCQPNGWAESEPIAEVLLSDELDKVVL